MRKGRGKGGNGTFSDLRDLSDLLNLFLPLWSLERLDGVGKEVAVGVKPGAGRDVVVVLR